MVSNFEYLLFLSNFPFSLRCKYFFDVPKFIFAQMFFCYMITVEASLLSFLTNQVLLPVVFNNLHFSLQKILIIGTIFFKHIILAKIIKLAFTKICKCQVAKHSSKVQFILLRKVFFSELNPTKGFVTAFLMYSNTQNTERGSCTKKSKKKKMLMLEKIINWFSQVERTYGSNNI